LRASAKEALFGRETPLDSIPPFCGPADDVGGAFRRAISAHDFGADLTGSAGVVEEVSEV